MRLIHGDQGTFTQQEEASQSQTLNLADVAAPDVPLGFVVIDSSSTLADVRASAEKIDNMPVKYDFIMNSVAVSRSQVRCSRHFSWPLTRKYRRIPCLPRTSTRSPLSDRCRCARSLAILFTADSDRTRRCSLMPPIKLTSLTSSMPRSVWFTVDNSP